MVFSLRSALSVLDLAIVIPTAPKETLRRCNVRDSWKWQLKKYGSAGSKRSIKLYFIIGDSTGLYASDKKTLEEEKNQYGDIHELQGFTDEYDRLGEKMLEIFKVCSGIFGELVTLLEEKEAFDIPRVYAGTFWGGLPILQPSLKEATGMENYPVNARGAGYILSRDLVDLMANTPVPFKHVEAEDAMIGTFLAPYEYTRIDFNVCPLTPQCGCAITCNTDTHETAESVYQVDHYNTPETLRWKQRRYELFGDSCWRVDYPAESSCGRAVLRANSHEYYFDAVTTDVLHEGIIVPDHTSTRVGVCQTSFEWQTSADWGPCSRECDGGIRTRFN
ncbi:beta-1,3-galactosyltransferase, putative [Perkinsus marinus ATCC 50983]|uniref:Hexosyltransferase n=1 Tax=Perkinsus marinus (strain ATCC 50983 / TXsc) TaxID=423536 RepID=C5KB97_PERM5|nr:beta-1,3-galactosyltransferase, putative [Perkinsus marinus ATCC 50983]EER18423.1 beta-1,3-galactosyltransferase, putative [Perkinsus marinus ATCC 50983]|eukprot:XP_002786627.1 beta-1,3-galactosyltransferase, putative [Perkinsus marinus ATCC 50983]